MIDLKKDIFDKPESILRNRVINDAVKVELAVNIIIKSAFGVNSKITNSFDKSSSLSFFQKVNLLSDLSIIEDDIYKQKLGKFAELRNEFAHRYNVKNFESCNPEIFKYLKKHYKSQVLEETYEELLVDIHKYLIIILKKLEIRGEQIIFTEYKSIFNKLLWDYINANEDIEFQKRFNEVYLRAQSEFDKLELPYYYGDKSLF